MSIVLPRLTTFDPETSSEGTLDPLGLYLIADQLVTRLVPAVRDRLGCKAENRHSIHVYLPYLASASDERQFRVMRGREQWFRIVMGQDEVTRLIPNEDSGCRPNLPEQSIEQLNFSLEI